jgi:hypothetical protein
MDELIQVVEDRISTLKTSIEYNKKYTNYPFTDDCDHYYKLMLLQNRADNWEQFRSVLFKFKNNRCKPIRKKSSELEQIMKVEIDGM